MKTSTTFSILFWLKQSKAKKKRIKIINLNTSKNCVKDTNQEPRVIKEYLNQFYKGIIKEVQDVVGNWIDDTNKLEIPIKASNGI